MTKPGLLTDNTIEQRRIAMFDGKQIYVRPLEEDDLALRVKWVNDPEIHNTLMFDYPLSLARTTQWFRNTLMDSSKANFSIVDRAGGNVIGMTGLLDIDLKNRRAQFYITIGEKEYWGRKIADEVIEIILRYGFTEIGLNKIYLYTLSNNERARKVYERNGFTQEGVLREHHYCAGKLQDLHQHGILKREWESRLTRDQRLAAAG